LICDTFTRTRVTGALHLLSAKAFNFVSGHTAEIFVKGVARLKLLAIYEECIRAWERVAMFIKISE
jgi:hypothetical protein